MILWLALLMSPCCLGRTGAAAGSAAGLERIEKCGIRCSQGLQCKTKPHSLFPRPCQPPPDGLNASTAFRNVSVSTVMRCEGRQRCSLHLSIKIKLPLMESIHGVSICTVAIGMMEKCQNVSFKRASRGRVSGRQVDVESDCTEVPPSQLTKVRVKTVPSYCGLTWTGTYKAPECISEDLQRHVPECITGRLSYDVSPLGRELTVGVSDMLEDRDYRLRLCRRDFICVGMGLSALIRKDDPVRSVALPFSRPLPCLCIEGWSDTSDAPRVQVCPFQHRVEELWSGITFDPLEGTLSWEPACPVTAVVALCQRREGVCVDLPRASRNVSRAKITFAKVDPHPQLCVKFTAASQSWTRCPFADATFQDNSSLLRPVTPRQASWDWSWLVVPAGFLLTVCLVCRVLLTVCKRRKAKINGCMSEQRTGLDFHCAVPALQTKPVLHGGALVPESLQRGNNTETDNLISA